MSRKSREKSLDKKTEIMTPNNRIHRKNTSDLWFGLINKPNLFFDQMLNCTRML